MSTESAKFIDVEKILREKNPGLARWLPRFVLNWIKRILHEEEINEIMPRNDHYYGLQYNARGLEELGATVESVHPGRMPTTGRVILVSNHPLGGLDGMALIKAVGEIRPDVRFLVNDILKNLKNYGEIFVGVNKVGGTSATALKTIEEVYASEAAVLVFPAGLVSRKQHGKIMDLEWKKSFISKAIKYNTLIVPVFIEGKNSNFFYNLSLWRKRLGIKANIEMFFLADEMFRQRGQTIRIHFGKPFSPEVFTDKYTHLEWAQRVKDYVYSEDLKSGKPFS